VQAAGNAALAGLAEDGSFRIDLGRGIQLGADRLHSQWRGHRPAAARWRRCAR
jgi:hypothetical protein